MKIMTCRRFGAAAGRPVLALATVLALGACDNSNAARGAEPVSAGQPAPASYVLVIQERPASVDAYFDAQKKVYALCAAVAAAKNIAVKPFATLPADFVSLRSTYASDGKRILFRTVSYSMQLVDWEHNDDCATRIVNQSSVSVLSDGQDHMASRDENGKVTTSGPDPYPNLPVDTALLDDFATPKIVNGIPLKCDTNDLCIVDPARAVVAQGRRPVIVSARVDHVPPGDTTIFTEPVSLTVGKPIDPALFAMDKF